MFLSIFKMMLNAERCSVLPSSTVTISPLEHCQWYKFFTRVLPLTTCSTCMEALPVCFLFRNLCQNSMKQDIHRSSASMFHFLLLNICRMLFVPPLFVNQSSAYCMLFTVHCIVMKRFLPTCYLHVHSSVVAEMFRKGRNCKTVSVTHFLSTFPNGLPSACNATCRNFISVNFKT